MTDLNANWRLEGGKLQWSRPTGVAATFARHVIAVAVHAPTPLGAVLAVAARTAFVLAELTGPSAGATAGTVEWIASGIVLAFATVLALTAP